jgi:hypothetical protein
MASNQIAAATRLALAVALRPYFSFRLQPGQGVRCS